MLGPAEVGRGRRQTENLLPRELSGHTGAPYVVELAEAMSMMRRHARMNNVPQNAYAAETLHRLVDADKPRHASGRGSYSWTQRNKRWLIGDSRTTRQRRRQVPADENGGQRRKHGRKGKQGQGVVREDRKLTRMLRGRP
jgi:hypothetical protein